MATERFFDNKIVKLPGAYSTIVSGEQSQPISLDFGKVLVIDTGVEGAGWGGGSGINGELAKNKDSVYRFKDLASYQAFLKGGLFWKSADALFKPDKKSGALGVSEVIHARAATTTKAVMTFTATGGGANGGSFIINTKDEGVNANGVLTTTHLDKGYAFLIRSGIKDTAKWILDIYVGGWVGNHTDGISYNEISKADSEAKLVVSSPEFNNIQDLIDWGGSDSSFGKYFVMDAASAIAGTGEIDQDDADTAETLQVATGGTETFSEANLQLILDAVQEESFSFILCDQYGKTDYKSAEVTAIKNFITGQAKFKSSLYVGGGKDDAEFEGVDSSIAMGAYFNSSYVHVVHGEAGLASDVVAEGFRYFPTMYTAALMVGRTAGKQPQVPLTKKTLGVDKLSHNLTKIEKEKALDAGVKVIVYDQGLLNFVCLQDVNTLQDNKRLFTPQGKSFQGSFMRIVEQINKELVVNAEIDLLSDENGVNANTLSSGMIKNWTETYLESRLAQVDLDNLLLDYRNVTVTKDGSAWLVNYGIVVNNEINKLFFTGYLFS